MPIDPTLLEISNHHGPAFQPLANFGGWRVAMLNFIEHLLPQNLTNMQRHDETDEVFVLLQGHCILFIGDGNEDAGLVKAVDMEPLTVYNVKKGTWHNHTLSEDASVLVVENLETTNDNSPFCSLSTAQKALIRAETNRLWNEAGI